MFILERKDANTYDRIACEVNRYNRDQFDILYYYNNHLPAISDFDILFRRSKFQVDTGMYHWHMSGTDFLDKMNTSVHD